MSLLRALGLMSGTSMDGIDAALVETDGKTIVRPLAARGRPYSGAERTTVRTALAVARTLQDRAARPGPLAEAEQVVTDAHAEAVEALLAEAGLPASAIDVVGFHGQTVFHDPARRLTVQIGDGPALARRLGIDVVHDFRAADVAAGGEGAPFVPAYHQALAASAGLAAPAVVVNIGGVANITWIAADGGLVACDTGPGNALIDDLMLARAGQPMDVGGRVAATGRVDEAALARLMDDPYFALPAPKSLDRDHFSAAPVAGLELADAAATLAAFTAASLATEIRRHGVPTVAVVCGGGARNPVILAELGSRLECPVRTADQLGWRGDFVEAEAFAYLAVRSLKGLPLSFPRTTGVPRPMPGGVLSRHDAGK